MKMMGVGVMRCILGMCMGVGIAEPAIEMKRMRMRRMRRRLLSKRARIRGCREVVAAGMMRRKAIHLGRLLPIYPLKSCILSFMVDRGSRLDWPVCR